VSGDLTHVKGLAKLNDFLQQVPVKMETNVLRGAMRAGANVIAPVARANASVESGELRDGIKVSVSSRNGRVTGKVKLTGKHAFLGRWLEYGVAAHLITAAKGFWLFFGGMFAKSVQHPGFQPKPFMRPALDSQAQAAVVAAAEYMKKRLSTKHGLDTSAVDIEPQ
jgi:HK97 gp10 family phage protein